MRLAAMQPYLFPYAGYYCLHAACDVLVLRDAVQYPKGGYVNRNRLTTLTGEREWLTLPVLRPPTDTLIKDVEFQTETSDRWERQLRRFKVFKYPRNEIVHATRALSAFRKPIDFILKTLDMTKRTLGFGCEVVVESEIKKLRAGKGAQGVVDICRHFGTTEYVNAPGGRFLYEPSFFRERGIELKILEPYAGDTVSILERLVFENIDELKKEIQSNVRFI